MSKLRDQLLPKNFGDLSFTARRARPTLFLGATDRLTRTYTMNAEVVLNRNDKHPSVVHTIATSLESNRTSLYSSSTVLVVWSVVSPTMTDWFWWVGDIQHDRIPDTEQVFRAQNNLSSPVSRGSSIGKISKNSSAALRFDIRAELRQLCRFYPKTFVKISDQLPTVMKQCIIKAETFLKEEAEKALARLHPEKTSESPTSPIIPPSPEPETNMETTTIFADLLKRDSVSAVGAGIDQGA